MSITGVIIKVHTRTLYSRVFGHPISLYSLPVILSSFRETPVQWVRLSGRTINRTLFILSVPSLETIKNWSFLADTLVTWLEFVTWYKFGQSDGTLNLDPRRSPRTVEGQIAQWLQWSQWRVYGSSCRWQHWASFTWPTRKALGSVTENIGGSPQW